MHVKLKLLFFLIIIIVIDNSLLKIMIPFLIFLRNSILFSTVAAQVCIPTNSALGFLFSTIFPVLVVCWFIDGRHAGITYTSKDLKIAKVAISRQVDKKTVVHLHNGMLLARKKKALLLFAIECMDLEIIMLSNICQLKKEKCHMILHMESN